MERKRGDSAFIQRGKKNTILPNNSISFPGMIVIIVLINSISNFGVISLLPQLDNNVSNEEKLH